MYYVFLFLLFAEVENKFDWEDLCCMLLGLIWEEEKFDLCYVPISGCFKTVRK